MKFEKRSEIKASARELFEWHAKPGAFQRLTPPWQSVEVVREDPGLQEGKRIEIKLSTPAGTKHWKARHTSCIDGKEFTDTQDEGPFRSWTHRHSFRDTREYHCEMSDMVEYKLPFGFLGDTFGGGFAKEQIEKTFEYRHWLTAADFEFKHQLPNFRKLKIAITGGSGFLGTQLNALLSTQGHEVRNITRSKKKESDIRWDPVKGEIELSELEGLDAVINLAGENLVSGRWNEERKKRLWSSRVDSTAFLIDALLRLEDPPSVFLSGSASGYYGTDPEQEFTEGSKRGEGFLAELCEAWENAALRAGSCGMRVCLLRTGIVLDPRGGALHKMLPAFRLGAGGPLGDGKQWFPWVAQEDWIRAVNWLLFAEKATGPFNLVSPQVVRQRDFATALGKVLHRPSFLPAPKAALSLVLGEMADEALMASARVKPVALQEKGYPFLLSDLETALSRVL